MKKNYYFEDFVEKNYRKLLKKTNSKTIFYDEIKLNKNFTLWRHDVDVSVHRAYKLAKIENKLKKKATYFFLLGSNYYNIFEVEIKNLVFKIMSLGHQLGLHFDATNYNIKTKKEFEKYLLYEKKILENLFQTEIKVFSFHNPTEEIMKYDSYKYAKMINAYAKYFKQHVEYCSDSSGYWRHKRLEYFLNKKYNNIQVNTHPCWWQKDIMPPFSRIKRCIDGRAKKTRFIYADILKKIGRENIK